eukprot:Nk52_evm4s163 gene=Nk52_evmTU4s163
MVKDSNNSASLTQLQADSGSSPAADFTQEELDIIFQRPEGLHARMKRKFMENPFIPVGCALTGVTLVGGLKNFQGGSKSGSQFFMRARVIAQGATVVALVLGAVYGIRASTGGCDDKKKGWM